MKRKLWIALLVLIMVLLWGCGEETGPDTRILVNIRKTPGITVQNNGQYILPGEDAVFLLSADEGREAMEELEEYAESAA
jgi:hypothetical protein